MSPSRFLHRPSSVLARRWVFLFLSLSLLVGALHFNVAQAASPQAQTYTISGRVLDGFGNGIAGATVTMSGAQSATTTTDSSGNYAFNDLPPGNNYILSPYKAGQYTGYATTVNNLNSNQTVNLRLDAYITINAHVVDTSGNGVEGVEMQINGSSISFAKTNVNGDLNMNVSMASTSGSNSVILSPHKTGYTFNPPSVTLNSDSPNQVLNFVATATNAPLSYIQFGTTSYSVGEGDGKVTIDVSRSGDLSAPASVKYFTGDAGVATQKSDYTMASGTLYFGAGENSKFISVLITDNAYPQGSHGFFVQLSQPTGSNTFLGSNKFVPVTILDNDTAQATTNPLDDAQFFVRQHYSDFFNRVPDSGGLFYWTDQINGNVNNTPAPCAPGDSNCVMSRRINVSAAYFVENEFQQTGYVIYRLNRAALGLIPTYSHFMAERNDLNVRLQQLQSRLDYANVFVAGGIFKQFYPDTMTPSEFVNKLFDTAGLTPFAAEREQMIQEMTVSGKTRAQILLEVIELSAFKEKEYNPAFVLMQYYGYLRRDPDSGGYQFWLDILNNREPNNYRAMVCAFITSAEYQQRFSPVVTHFNSECGN